MVKIAIVRIRGIPNVRTTIRDAMEILGLKKKHTCVILEDSESLRGQIKKIDNYVTWGEISEDTLKLLLEKRKSTSKQNEYKTVFFLAPPKKGFERGGIKKPFTVGGALGYRADKINDLITRMV